MNLRNLLLPILLLVTATVAAGQDGPPARDLILAKRIFYALNPKISAELKLTKDDRQKLLDAYQGCLSTDGDMIRLELHGTENLDEMEHAAMDTLSVDKRQRLEELWLQHFDGVALVDEAVAKKVQLTEDQRRQIDKLAEQGGSEIGNLMSDGPTKDAAKGMEAIRAKYGKQMLALLTTSQAKTFSEMKGKQK